MWPFSKKRTPATDAATPSKGLFSTDLGPLVSAGSLDIEFPQPANAIAMDSQAGERYPLKGSWGGVPEAVAMWYASQSFIGYHYAAMLAQHWLIDKACSMPAKDAIRQGFEIDVDAPDGVDGQKAIALLKKYDKRMKINATMREFIRFGRVYGVRVAMFVVESTDPEYYQKPFNIDGVARGSYRGISQIDPQWITPDLSDANLSDPTSMKFYEPSFYRVRNQLVHRSHLAIYIPYPVTDFLKPSYQFGGVSVPQRIYERVYASERTANEAPILAMTKRVPTFQAAEGADMDQVKMNMAAMAELRDNHGILVHGKDEMFAQTDTSLADLDAVIMTQYQLVAAIAEVPATKLLGTSPKGFGAAGEYEEASYREHLEGIQQDLDDLLDRHHELVMKAWVAPKLGIEPVEVTSQWAALDSPTAAEFAAIELQKAQTDQIYTTIMAIDGDDVRGRLRADKESPYFGLANAEGEGEEIPQGNVDPITAQPVAQPENPATIAAPIERV